MNIQTGAWSRIVCGSSRVPRYCMAFWIPWAIGLTLIVHLVLGNVRFGDLCLVSGALVSFIY